MHHRRLLTGGKRLRRKKIRGKSDLGAAGSSSHLVLASGWIPMNNANLPQPLTAGPCDPFLELGPQSAWFPRRFSEQILVCCP